MDKNTLYYIANARIPSEKAHGIQIAKMCEAFLEEGINVVLVVPYRGRAIQSAKEFYGLRIDIPIVRLPALNWYSGGRVLYHLSSFSFMVSYFLYVVFFVNKRRSIIYTVDLDHFTYGFIPPLRLPFFSEMHGGKPPTRIHKYLFNAVTGIIATNSITKKQIEDVFHLPSDRIIIEPNGVDLATFSHKPKEEARATLNMSQDIKLALYVGRIFSWKGLEILAEAAELLPENITVGMVGGSAQEFKKVTGQEAPKRITFFGDQPYKQIPLWTAAADVLIVLGTKRDEQSYNYTSPMKIFEYMAMRRPIVASKTPALKNILDDSMCFFYEPDSATDLARAIVESLSSGAEGQTRSDAAYRAVSQHIWAARAERIRAFMNKLQGDRSI